MFEKSDAKRIVELSLAYLSKKKLSNNEELIELREVMRFHEWSYYVDNNSLISDRDYDFLFDLLKSYEEEHPELITKDSPTQRVSSDLSDNFVKVSHHEPLLSLANSYDENDLLDFDRQVKKLLDLSSEDEVAYHVEPKLDGISLAVHYKENEYQRGATRGNGTEGEDISNNVKTIKSLPLKVDFAEFGIDEIELRGEAYMRLDEFERLNREREQNGDSIYANPRNVVSGSLRMKDPNETASRRIDLVIYQINYLNGERRWSCQSESLDWLKTIGFKTPADLCLKANNIQEVIQFVQKAEEKRYDLNYEIDGLVIKVDGISDQESMGSTSHHPRWAIAYKFKAKQGHSILEKIEYQVGKTGTITPVAKIKPIELAGVTVSSISLHNEDFIRTKDLRLGDTVVVERAGDVIPYIVKSIEELRNGEEQEINFPKHCPVEGNDQVLLEKLETEAAWRCPKCICGQQDVQRLIHFISKSGLNIDGFGKSMIERFYNLGWLSSYPDIFRLNYDSIAELEGFGEKSSQNLQKAISEAMRPSLSRFLSALSIHHLGKRASKLIANEIKHITDLYQWDEEKYCAIKEIGPVLAKNMVAYFTEEENQQLIGELVDLGLDLSTKAEDKIEELRLDGKLSGKSVLFTGTLVQMTRKEAQKMAQEQGAKLASAVSKNLSILVVGEKAGSKLTKAQSLGTVEILDEEAFIKLINE